MKISAIMWVFDRIWVICEKPPFLHSLDALIKMLAKSLAVLKKQTQRMADHIHRFQTQLTERCLFIWFWVDKRPVCCFISIKNSLDTQTRFRVDGEWNWPKVHLCSRCTTRYTLAYTRARTTYSSTRNVRCTIVYASILLGARKSCTKISNSWTPDLAHTFNCSSQT